MPGRYSGKIGFMTCASYRVNREAVLDAHGHAREQLSRLCGELDVDLVACDVVPASDTELDGNLDAISRAEPDAVVLHLAGWTEDQTTLRIVDSLKSPVMLWVTGDVFADGVSLLVAHVAYMEASSYLKKMGRVFSRLYGGPDEASFGQLRAFIVAARGAAALRGLRFGWIGAGYGSQSILDGAFDEKAFSKKTGVDFVRIDLNEVFERYRETDIPTGGAREEMLRALGVPTDVLNDQAGTDGRALCDSLRLVSALQETAAEHDLGALSLRCFPEFKENDVPSPCLAIAMLNQRGVTASCEGDVLSGVSMHLLSALSGHPATMMDVFAADEDLNALVLFHCGSAAGALAGPNGRVAYRTHCKPGNHRPGVTIEFSLPPGRVSFLKFDMLGPCAKLFLYRGDTVAPADTLRGTQAVVRTDAPVRILVERLLDHGVSHHQVLSFGDVGLEARYFAELTGTDLICL